MSAVPLTLEDYAQAAQASLSPAAWAYFSGGAGDEHTLARNAAAWQAWGLQPRVLQALSGGHTRCQLLGQAWPFPALVAPMAHQRWAHADGELGMTLAAAAQGCGMVLSNQTSTPLQAVAQAALADQGRGPLWFQLYWHPDKAALMDVVRQVEQAGFEALMLTVDAPVSGIRDRERRHPMQLPPDVRLAHPMPSAKPTAGWCQGIAEAAPTWADVAWLQTQTTLPIMLKGITHPDDARQAAALNVAGVVVSNHGGRTLDTMAATADMLPAVKAALVSAQSSALLLVDGGIRRGTDVFKALALGADAVMLGRPCLFALAHGGARSVAHALRLLRDEFEMTMALMGCPTIADIRPHHVMSLPLLAQPLSRSHPAAST